MAPLSGVGRPMFGSAPPLIRALTISRPSHVSSRTACSSGVVPWRETTALTEAPPASSSLMLPKLPSHTALRSCSSAVKELLLRGATCLLRPISCQLDWLALTELGEARESQRGGFKHDGHSTNGDLTRHPLCYCFLRQLANLPQHNSTRAYIQ
eukprot:scaffold84463_cov72-Phaeocystis_antarctica.AAC.4